MSKLIAVFYTPDDDLEHAVQFNNFVGPGGASFGKDTSFSPGTQGHFRPLLAEFSFAAIRITAISGLYSPLDSSRYIFFATSENWLGVSWYSSDPHVSDPIVVYAVANPLIAYPNGSIVDIAAFFSPDDNQMHVNVLMANGDLYHAFGTHDEVFQHNWTVIPFLFQSDPGGQSITAYYSAQDQQRHVLIATDHDITHIHFTTHSTEQEALAHLDERIIAISGFYTPDDGVEHVVVATTNGVRYQVDEVVFQIGVQAPTLHLLGTLNFELADLGAYVKPDTGRHVIMLASASDPTSPNQLYLSWYYPGWSGFAFGPWPNATLWP